MAPESSRPEWLPESGRPCDYRPPDQTATRGGIDASDGPDRSEKLRILGQLAAGVAHDLNQSLALVGGYSELALLALDRPSPELAVVREYVSIIHHATSTAGETVRQILAYARSSSPGPARPVDISALLQDVAKFTAPRWHDLPEAEGRPIRLIVATDLSEGPLVVTGWPSVLHDALTNLVINAVDALPAGGTICLAARRKQDHIEIDVEDDGHGMSDDVRARVFDPFFTTRGSGGTGLGLPRVQQAARRHGGDVSITSRPGHGTVCRLRLPLADRPPVQTVSSPVALATLTPHRQLRILIVEDLPLVAAILTQIVQLRGHQVVYVRSAEEALLWLEQASVDLVISDLGLGDGMNGWQFAEIVRAHWPDLRFGLATGWEAAIDPDEAQERGVNGLLSKPYTIREVLRFLEPSEFPSTRTSAPPS